MVRQGPARSGQTAAWGTRPLRAHPVGGSRHVCSCRDLGFRAQIWFLSFCRAEGGRMGQRMTPPESLARMLYTTLVLS